MIDAHLRELGQYSKSASSAINKYIKATEENVELKNALNSAKNGVLSLGNA